MDGALELRRIFTTEEAKRNGITLSALKWGVEAGKWQRVAHGVYVEGADPPTQFERAVALVIVTGGVASGSLAGVLFES